MKKVSIIYKSEISQSAIDYTVNNINIILGEYVKIIPYFLDQLDENELIEADAHLILYEEMLPKLSPHINDFSKVIIVKRSILKKNLLPLNDIPVGEDVLVVNDSRESTLETVYMLYELGFNHMSLYPYIDEALPQISTNTFEYCIATNDSLHLVPKSCRKIVNIQNREISFETFKKLMHVLDINNPAIQSNLLTKIDEDFDTNFNFIEDYLSSYLKEQLLTNIVEKFAQGLVLVDKYGKINYINEKGYDIFGIVTGDFFEDSPNFNSLFVEKSDFKNQLISIGDVNYMAEKHTIGLFNDILGFCLVLQDEKTLRDRETSLNRQLKKKGLYAKHTFDDIIHVSESMKKCIELAKQAATSDYTVLLRGESGTGKELLAQSIHNYSLRANAPFVAINCAALPETLLESELFGYEEGSFTGAHKGGKVGLFEQAQRGTIFLDEIGDISANLQSRLLRVIQEKHVMRVGSDKIINVDVRIIGATNADLEKKIQEGKFRADLFYRLNVIPLNISPLRNRKDDILPLLNHFTGKTFNYLSAKEKSLLTTYSWPGNVRELENTAAYYKLLGSLPENLWQSQENSMKEDDVSSKEPLPILTKDDLSKLVLEIIAESSARNIGIGRMTIVNKLCEDGHLIGEGKVKSILKYLQSKELIVSTAGRGGSYITEKGLSHLSNQ